jgi:trigger factor
VGLEPGARKSFTLTMSDEHRDKDVANKPAQFEIALHWVKERQLPELDDEFAQQVGEYSDVAGLRAAIEAQLRQREEDRVREQLEEAAMSKLVEISTIEFPPQLVEHQAQHMLESFQRNVEQQGLQLQQYLRLVGKEEDALQQEIRAEAETRVRRSLALDAFADAEKIDIEEQEVEDEARRAAAGTNDAEAVERLALTTPQTRARVQEAARERKAMARLLELATSNGSGRSEGKKKSAKIETAEKPAEPSQTSDTGRQSRTAKRSVAAAAEEEQGSA